MPFQSPQRRIEGMQIQIRKKQIEQAIAQFNDKAQQAGQPELSLDMRQIELGLVNNGRSFVENNANYQAFLNAAQKPRQNPAPGHDGG